MKDFNIYNYDEYEETHQDEIVYVVVINDKENKPITSADISVAKSFYLGVTTRGIIYALIIDGKFKNCFYSLPDSLSFEEEQEAINRKEIIQKALEINDKTAFNLLVYNKV